MASEDAKMEDAAAEDQKQQQQPPKQKRERTIAEVAAAASDDDEDMEEAGDGAAGASAQTPASAGGAGSSKAAAAAAAAETAGTAGNKKTPVERPTREDPAAVEKLRAYVASLGGTLGPGWIGVYKMRVGGSTAGQYDLYYRSPEGRMIRSRAEVLRILGLDPSGGAGGSGAAKKAASAGGKGSKKKGATAQQQADEGGTPAAGATGAAAAGATPGGAGAGGSKWTLPVELPREEAAKAAKERAAELGLKPPFTTDRGVTILSLGTFHKASGYYDATHIWPLGYRAAWVPPHDPTAAAAAVPAKKAKKKDAKDAADKASDKGASDAAAEPAADGATEQEAKADAEQEPKAAEAEAAAEAPATAAAGLPPPPPYRFISEIRTDTGKTVTGGEGPAFAVLLEPNPDVPAAADGGSAAAAAEPLLVHTAAAPDVVWSAIADLQVSAAALVKRAKPSGAGAQPTAMQRALAAMPSVGKLWGMDCFGLSDVRVLQLLEALPGVDAAEEYLYVQQRNSWDLEASSIATKRSVVLSAAPNRRAAAAATKQRKRQQQLSMEAFVDRPPASPKADGASEQQPAGAGAAWDGLEDLAAAAAAATDGGAGKKSAAKPKGEGKGGRMTREDIEIRGVLDRLVERVSLVMAEPDEKERQKMLKAMEKADRAAARRREKTAEKAAEKAAGTPAAGDKEKDKEKEEKKEKEKEKKENKKEKEKKEQEKKEKPPKARAAKDKDKDAEAAPDVAAVVAVPQLPGNQVDERALPTAEVPAPPGVPLQLSYPVTTAGDAAVGEAGAVSAAAASLSTEEVQQLLAVYQFLWDHRKLLGMEGRVPSLADLLAVVSESPTRLPAPARRAADEVHLALVRLLVGEALDELFEYVAESSNLGRRDISPAVPPITATTWPELARRYLAAAAAARYLATSEPRSSSLVPLQLPGQLQNLEPADWLHYLLAGLNFPHLLSRIALLPHASSRWAADALLAADDARARAAAERALQGVKSFDLQHLDGEGQVRRGRRLLHALLSLPEGGEQLGFYAPEFGEVVRAPRGLDLHMVAARLDAGLYQSTGDWLQALATDVRSSLALWRAALKGPKGKDIPGHQDARPALADEAERKLNELLADPDTTLALPAPRAPPSVDDAAAAADKADGDSEMQDADGAGGSGGKGTGKAGGGKSRKNRSSRSRKQQEAGEEEEEDNDPCSLDDPTRLFNPRAGCRVCWLDADKNRILLCDGCDGEYHCYCVEPPLLEVPEGAWFCPSCTARGLGLPKAEDESEDLMDVDAGGERRSTPRALTPSRAAAGGASISPSDDSAPGRTPCSPAFQHCHSHSHLVSDLHERAAARRPQPHGAAVAASAAEAEAPALPAGPSGSGMAGAEVGEAPLSLPPDVPEGPRVTLRANSRPGLQELAGLLRLAHLLGNYDYATGGPVCASTAAASAGGGAAGGGWTPSRRLALLSALCELAMDTNALRNSLDEIVETRKKARVEANAIRSKARQIQEEQAAAKKAAVEKENAPKPEGDADANAGAGAAAASKGGKGSKSGKGGAKDAKAGKGGKADKGAEASGKEAGEEGADEGGGTQEAKQDGKEATAAKSSRGSRRPTDLSVLPEAELKRLMSLEAQVEGLAVRQEALGEDRHGSRYWWLGADLVNPQGPQGVVLVELLPPGHAAAEQARASRAFGEREAVRRKEEKEEQARKARREEKRKKRVGAGEEEEEGEEEEPELDEWGLPKERQRQRAVPIGVDAAPGRSWAVFHSADRLNDLIGWLTPKGLREGPLRTALLRARDRIVASQAPAAAGDKQKHPSAAAAATAAPREVEQQQQSAPSAAEGSSDQPPAAVSVPPPSLLCPCVTVAGAGTRRGGAAARQGSVALPDAEDANGGAAVEPAEAVALRTELLALHRGLPIEAFSRFWGSPARQEQWCAFVGSATSPQQVCAALTVLEAMLVDEAFRPHWRLYCMPAQHPDLCTTWSAAWYRLGGLQGAIRKQIIPQRELHHQAAAAAEAAAGGRGGGGKGAAGKKDKGGAAAKQAQATAATTERYTSRRGGAAVPALPDISNVRSREAAALLSSHGVTGGKGQKDAGGRGQKRQRSADEDDEEEEEEGTENAAADRKRGKRAATAAAKDRSRRPGAGGRGRGSKAKKEESEEGEVAAEEEEEDQDAADEEEAAGSDPEASASGLEDEEESEEEEDDDEEDADSSDEEGGGRKRKSRPSRASARLQKKGEKSAPMTRRSSRLRKVDTDDEDESSSSGEEEEDARPAKRTRGATAAAKASTAERNKGGRSRGAAATAAESEDEEGSDSESEGRAAPAKGAQGRTRAGGSEPAAAATNKQQANGAKPAIGSRAAAILANRKRALADWSEESEDEEDDVKNSGGSGGESSSEEDEPAAAATGKKRGGAAAAPPATVAAGKRGAGRQQQQQQAAARKPPPRRMARSEVEYDVEDFDDLNT